MATTNLATNLATTTKVKKPETNLPYVQPNQNLPLSNNVANGAAGMQPVASAGQMAAGMVPQASPQTQQFNQTLNTAQNMAMQGAQAPNPTLDMTSQKTQELLQNPNQGFDANKQKQQTMESFDRERANALKAMQGEAADTAFLGTTIDKLSNQYLQGAEDRVMLERDTDLQNQQQERQNLLAALAEGRNTSTAEQNRFTSNIGALTNVIGSGEGQQNREFTGTQAGLDRTQQLLVQSNDLAGQKDIANLQNIAESGRLATQQDFQKAQSALDRAQQLAVQSGDIQAQKEIETIKQKFQSQMQSTELQFQEKLKTMDIESQASLTELKAALDKDQLLTSQDFQAAQGSLDRELSKALAEGDTAKAIQLLEMQQDFSSQMQDKQNEYATVERQATQAWQSGEAMTDREHEKVMQYIEQENAKAMQNNDINAQERLAQMGIEADLSLATANMNQQEKMAYLNNELANATANNDVGRTLQIQNAAHKLDLESMRESQGFEASQAELDRRLQTALQSNDFAQATSLQKMGLEFQANEAAKDRILEQSKIALQEKGLNADNMQREFERLTLAEENGTIAAGSALAYLQKTMSDSGIKIEAPDPNAVNAAIDAEYDAQMYQFLKTNPQYKNAKALTAAQKTKVDDILKKNNVSANGVLNSFYQDGYEATLQKYGMSGTDLDLVLNSRENQDLMSPEGQKAFNEYFNKTMYGMEGTEGKINQLITGVMSDTNLRGKDINDPVYKGLYDTASNFNSATYTDDKGVFSADVGRFRSVPANGSYFKKGDKLYKATSDIAVETSGEDYEYFTAIDVSSGQSITIKAPNGGDWALGLAQ